MASKKRIAQLDYYTGELIEIYESVSAAAWDNYTDCSTIKKAIRTKNGKMKLRQLWFEEV